MKSVLLELEDVDVSVVYEPEYKKEVIADTEYGPILRDVIVDININDIKAINDDGIIFDLSEAQLYELISFDDLLIECE